MKKSRYVAELSFDKDGEKFNSYLMRGTTVNNLFLAAVNLGVRAIKTDAYLSDVPYHGFNFCLKEEQIQEAQQSLRKKGLYSYEATDWFKIYIVDTQFKHDKEASKLVTDFDNTAKEDSIVCANFWGEKKPIVDVNSALNNAKLMMYHYS